MAAAPEATAAPPPSTVSGARQGLANPWDFREIGAEAVWSLSTAKPGNGVEQIRDDNVDTYWQSDGAQPHLINVQFHRKMTVSELALYLDYNLDESYTPKKLSIRAGTTFHDLAEVHVVDLSEPTGWVSVPLRALDSVGNDDQVDEDEEDKDAGSMASRRPLRCFLLQVCVLSMHQNGRDTHIRQAKIFGPRLHHTAAGATAGPGGKLPTMVEFTQFATLR